MPPRGARREAVDEVLHAQLQLLEPKQPERVPPAAALFELDQFATITAESGQRSALRLLRQVALRAIKAIRVEDILARYGTVRFALLLPESSMEGACWTLQRVRNAIKAYPLEKHFRVSALTLSAGCAALSECQNAAAQVLVEQADLRVRIAMRLGGDCSVTSSSILPNH